MSDFSIFPMNTYTIGHRDVLLDLHTGIYIEFYRDTKIDIEETANSFQKETDPYLAYNPTNSVGGAALRQSTFPILHQYLLL